MPEISPIDEAVVNLVKAYETPGDYPGFAHAVTHTFGVLGVPVDADIRPPLVNNWQQAYRTKPRITDLELGHEDTYANIWLKRTSLPIPFFGRKPIYLVHPGPCSLPSVPGSLAVIRKGPDTYNTLEAQLGADPQVAQQHPLRLQRLMFATPSHTFRTPPLPIGMIWKVKKSFENLK